MVIEYDEMPQPEITITFWIKIFGNDGTNPNYDVFYYSDSTDTLKIKYNGDMKNDLDGYGLCLVFSDDQNDSIIARDKTYRKQFGKWTFISLSYYSDKPTAPGLKDTREYFPFHFCSNRNELLTFFKTCIQFNTTGKRIITTLFK
jgi:hypothetical protein